MPDNKLTPEMVEALNKPLPPEAVSPHPTKPYLSTIKAIYVVERLNEVFGLGGWFQKNEIVTDTGKMKVVHSYLTIPKYGIVLDNFGGNDNVDEGDAWKGAATDALTKMASYLGIGMDVFKGLADKGHQTPRQTPQNAPGTQETPRADKTPTPRQKAFIKQLCEEKGVTQNHLKDLAIDFKGNPSGLIEFLLKYQKKEELPTIQMTPEEEQMIKDIPF